MVQIQQDYSYHQQIGQIGGCARPSAPWDIDRGAAGVELLPGDGVYYDAANDNWIKPVDAATRKLVTHIVSFNANSFNFDIASPSTNNISKVVFAIDDVVPLASFGSFFVLAGETVEVGDAAIFNETTGKWIKYTPAAATANDLRKVPFSFYVDPKKTVASGEIVEVKIPTPNYAFASITDLEAQTVKVSIAAAAIKTLRATPVELVAAQGANTLIQFVSAMLVLTAGTEVLSETTDNLVIEYDDGAAAAATGDIEMTGFIDQAADTITNAIASADAIDALADVANKNIAIVNTGDGEIAGNASDDAVLDIYVTYRVLDLS